MDDLHRRPSKEKSVKEIELALGAALSSLWGQPYEVKIKNMDFNKEMNAWFNDSSEVSMTISKPVDFSFASKSNENHT